MKPEVSWMQSRAGNISEMFFPGNLLA